MVGKQDVIAVMEHLEHGHHPSVIPHFPRFAPFRPFAQTQNTVSAMMDPILREIIEEGLAVDEQSGAAGMWGVHKEWVQEAYQILKSGGSNIVEESFEIAGERGKEVGAEKRVIDVNKKRSDGNSAHQRGDAVPISVRIASSESATADVATAADEEYRKDEQEERGRAGCGKTEEEKETFFWGQRDVKKLAKTVAKKMFMSRKQEDKRVAQIGVLDD